MIVVSYSHLAQDLTSVLDEVCVGAAPIVVERPNGGSVVMLSRAEFESMAKTLHLLRSPRNAERLLQSIANLEAEALDEFQAPPEASQGS